MADDRYCAAPFVHASYAVDGKIQPCCAWTGPLYEPNGDPLEHESIKELRAMFMANQSPPGCDGCHRMESIGNKSFRIGLNEAYGRPTQPSLRYLEFNLGNLCNMKCRMCDSRSSSRWASDELELGMTPHPLRRWDANSINVDLSKVDRIKFKGGEPCLEQDTIVDILSRIRRDRGDLSMVQVDVTTNGTKVFGDPLMALLHECRQACVNISVDGIGAVNDYQRTGSDWDSIETNLREYQSSCGSSFVFQMTTTWTLLNANGAIGFMSWVDENLPRFAVYGDPIETPSYLRVSNIGQSMKSRIADKLKAWQTLDHIGWVIHNKKVLLDELSRDQVVPSDTVLGMIRRLDAIRGEDFAKVDPDVFESLR